MVIILVLMTIGTFCAVHLSVRAAARAGTALKHRWHIEKGLMKPTESSIY